MHIDTIPNRNSPAAVLLHEGYREDGKVRKRTLANLSHWDPRRVEGSPPVHRVAPKRRVASPRLRSCAAAWSVVFVTAGAAQAAESIARSRARPRGGGCGSSPR